MSSESAFDTSHTDQVEVHFPTTVMVRSHDGLEVLNRELMRLIRDLEDRYADTDENAVRQGTISTQGGYQTSTRMNLMTLDNAAVVSFRDQVLLPAAREYLQQVFGEESQQLNPWPVGWANLLHGGDWQGPHFHPTDKNVASGVYYVHLPEEKPAPEGCLEFINPIPTSVNHGFPFTRRVRPAEGRIVLFPPWYVHYVHPFRGEGERAIIAFDVLAQKPGLDLVF